MAMPFLELAALDLLRDTLDGQPFGLAKSNLPRDESTPQGSGTMDSASTETSESAPRFQLSIFSRADFPASISPLPANAPDWPASEAVFSLNSYELWRSLGLSGSCLRTSMRCYRAQIGRASCRDRV